MNIDKRGMLIEKSDECLRTQWQEIIRSGQQVMFLLLVEEVENGNRVMLVPTFSNADSHQNLLLQPKLPSGVARMGAGIFSNGKFIFTDEHPRYFQNVHEWIKDNLESELPVIHKGVFSQTNYCEPSEDIPVYRQEINTADKDQRMVFWAQGDSEIELVYGRSPSHSHLLVEPRSLRLGSFYAEEVRLEFNESTGDKLRIEFINIQITGDNYIQDFTEVVKALYKNVIDINGQVVSEVNIYIHTTVANRPIYNILTFRPDGDGNLGMNFVARYAKYYLNTIRELRDLDLVEA